MECYLFIEHLKSFFYCIIGSEVMAMYSASLLLDSFFLVVEFAWEGSVLLLTGHIKWVHVSNSNERAICILGMRKVS